MVPEKRAKCEGRSTLYGKLVGVSSLCGDLRFRRTDSRKSKPQIYELLRKQYGQGAGGKDGIAEGYMEERGLFPQL